MAAPGAPEWHELGDVAELQTRPLRQIAIFFTELGFDVPQFPFIAHSRGWSAEDMERNVAYVQRSAALREGARALAECTVEKARDLMAHDPVVKTERAGRKAHKMDIVELE